MSESLKQDRLLGQVLDGRFRLDTLLGAGGMGKVYGGHQLSVERAVAVKVLREELSESHTLAQRFFREAKVVASLRHPNVVGLVEFGRDEERGLLYIVMEYIDGTSLGDLLRTGRLDAGLVVAIARQVCSALAEAHAAGVVHRDLKPDNVMLVATAEGALSVKVLDFGIALPTGEEARLTSTGAVVGTPHYMAPEQSQDKPVTARADIYSLGVLIYEMLTGRLPFVGDTPMAVLLKAITQPPPPLAQVLEPEHMPPPELVELVASMMEKEADQRPASVAVVAQHLDHVARTYALVAPRIHPGSTLDSLVIETASEQFVSAETAASPAPLTSERPAPALQSAPNAPRATTSPPVVPERKRFQKRFLLLPILPLFCCCLVLGGEKDRDRAVVPPVRLDMAADAMPATDAGIADLVDDVYTAKDASALPTAPKSPQQAKPPKRAPTPKSETPAAPPRDMRRAQMEEGGICQLPSCDFLGLKPGGVVCQEDSHCTAKCPVSGCPQICNGEADCNYGCDGGACKQLCSGQANCQLSCDGGNCQQQCIGGASCTMSCNGGNCRQSCSGQVDCKKSCRPGNCKG